MSDAHWWVSLCVALLRFQVLEAHEAMKEPKYGSTSNGFYVNKVGIALQNHSGACQSCDMLLCQKLRTHIAGLLKSVPILLYLGGLRCLLPRPASRQRRLKGSDCVK